MPLLVLIVLALLHLLMPSKIRLKAGRIGHVAKGVQYYVGNSYRALRAMVRAHKIWADRDVHRTKDHVLVITHWGKPLMHGFTDPGHHYPRGTPIEEMYWKHVRLFVAPGGYKIHTLHDDMNYCARVGIWPLYEPKTNALASTAIWRPVYDQYKQINARNGRRVFKIRGYALGRNAKCIPHMRAAGIPTSRIKRW